MIACPHCGWTRRGLRLPALCSHMIERHNGEKLVPAGGPYMPTQLCTLPGADWMRCWCGRRIDVSPRQQKHSQWARHIAECGGLAAHLLEVGMGLGGE